MKRRLAQRAHIIVPRFVAHFVACFVLAPTVAAAVLLLSPVGAADAQTSAGVRIENASAATVDAEPRQIIYATFRVANLGDAEREFSAEAELPDGWSLVMPLETFALKEREERLLFVSIMVPLQVAAGVFPVTVRAFASDEPAVYSAATVQVNVLAVANVQVTAPTQPLTVFAGDAYERDFTVRNLSNVGSRFTVETSSRPSWQATCEPASFVLEPGEARTVRVTVQTSAEVYQEVRHGLTLLVRGLDLDEGKFTAEGRVFTTVFPRVQMGSMYESLEGEGNLLLAWDDDTGELATQFMLDLGGELGEGRLGMLSFAEPFGSAERGQQSLSEEHFRIGYTDEGRGGINLGDITLDVTPLTERYFYGRGADFTIARDPMSLRFFGSRLRTGVAPERISGAQLSVDLPRETNVAITALRMEHLNAQSATGDELKSGRIWSVASTSKPIEQVELEGEYAWSDSDFSKEESGESDTAYRVAAKLKRARFYFDGEYVRAGTFFPGYWRDQELSRAYLSFSLARDIRLWGNIGDTSRNLVGDPLKPKPEDSYRSLGLGFPAGPLGRISVFRRWSQREDTNLRKWHEREVSTNLQLSRQFEWFSVSGTAAIGERRDYLAGDEQKVQRYRVLISARPRSDLSVTGGYSWDTESWELSGEQRDLTQLWFSVDGTIRLGKRTGLALNFNRSGGTGDGGISWLSAEFKHELSGGRRLNLQIRRQSGGFAQELAMLLEYVHPLGVPMRWFPKSGSLKGRIFVTADGELPLGDVVVSVEGKKAATDEDGRFLFPDISAGEHELQVDRTTLGLGMIPDLPLPFSFIVNPGETVNLDVPVVRSATIKGRVVGPPGKQRSQVVVPSREPARLVGLSGVVVVLTGEKDRLARVTDENGRFSFTDLRPGRWKLTVAEGQVPVFHELNPSEFELDLLPGQAEEGIEFVISPVERPVVVTAEEDN